MKLLPCPFCGDEPDIETIGSYIDITCCVSMALQKSDILTISERETWNNESCTFSEEAEQKALTEITNRWNSRTTDNRVPVAYILRTGHGTKIVETKPDCEIDYWKPLYE